MGPGTENLPTLPHAGVLEDWVETPPFLLRESAPRSADRAHYSCSFCGLGDSGHVEERVVPGAGDEPASAEGIGLLHMQREGQPVALEALLQKGRLRVSTRIPIAEPGGVLSGELKIDGNSRMILAREAGREEDAQGRLTSQVFSLYSRTARTRGVILREPAPTGGCVKLKLSMGSQSPVFPIHSAPSRLEGRGRRRSISYPEAIGSFAELLLAHRPPRGRTLLYACGQVDYFTIFSFQEVFRLLGVRNLTGNAEHCLNAGAVHNEVLTGQEGPFLTVEQSLKGPNRFFLLNGWNGLITHPPAFYEILKRPDADVYLVEVAVTESAKMVAAKLGPDRVLLVRSGSDPHLALAVSHEILERHPQAVDGRFIERYSDRSSFEAYAKLARSPEFAPEHVARRIAPEAAYEDRLLRGIRDIASRLARPEIVPINIPSVGLSQTKGIVAHCLWGSLLAMLGKYGLRPDSTPAGGTLRIPGQINAETEVQGLSRRGFMGRIPMTPEGAVDAARRMGLPDDAYDAALRDTPRAALDYSDPAEIPELIVCFGTQFESNMMERSRWVRKLDDPRCTLVVVDPIPDPFTLERAALVFPSPPHAAATKLYQNGEWRLTLSIPRKRALPQMRTDATIVYDAMAGISRRLRDDPAAAPDLVPYSGYLRARFEDGLPRVDGEVHRPALWDRILDYMRGGIGPLYCSPEGITWEDLLEKGSIVYGGVGTTRYRLDYDDPHSAPFGDVYRRPRQFTFFTPTAKDLDLPEGIILNSGRSTLTDDKARIRFATSTFNSGKATPAVDMPAENPLYLSLPLAARLGLVEGDRARVTNPETGESMILPVTPTDRVKGEAAYISFHKCRAEIEQGRYLNALTSHAGRCPYTSQTNVKATRVLIERVSP